MAIRIGTLPRVGALDQLRSTNGDGILHRARSNPRLVVAIAAGAVLILAWIGWAIYVTSSKGATAGLGVVIAWPAMIAALALISLPFIGGYLLVKRLSPSESEPSTATAEAEKSDAEGDEEADGEPKDSTDGESEDSDEGEEEGEEEEDEESDDQDDSDDEKPEPEAKTSSKKR